jgi:hypothetical protein
MGISRSDTGARVYFCQSQPLYGASTQRYTCQPGGFRVLNNKRITTERRHIAQAQGKATAGSETRKRKELSTPKKLY